MAPYIRRLTISVPEEVSYVNDVYEILSSAPNITALTVYTLARTILYAASPVSLTYLSVFLDADAQLVPMLRQVGRFFNLRTMILRLYNYQRVNSEELALSPLNFAWNLPHLAMFELEYTSFTLAPLIGDLLHHSRPNLRHSEL
jgi:hypothetical protein